MALTIKVIHYKEEPLDPPRTATFDQKGGTVGRSADNHIVLADDEKVVSGIHATIEYQNGCYYYVDNSLNGTHFTNRNQLVRHKKIQLHDQDKLRIGDYNLLINITKEDSEILNAIDPSLKSSLPKQSFPQKDSSLSFFDQDNGKKHIGSKKADVIENDKFFDSSDSFFDSSEKEAFTGYPKSISSKNNEYNVATNDGFIPPVPKEPSKGNSDFPEDLTLEDFFGNEAQSAKTTSDAGGDKASVSQSSNKSILRHLDKPASNKKNPKKGITSSGVWNKKAEDRSLSSSNKRILRHLDKSVSNKKNPKKGITSSGVSNKKAEGTSSSSSNKSILRHLDKSASNKKNPKKENASPDGYNRRANAASASIHHSSAQKGMTSEEKSNARSMRPSSSGRASIPTQPSSSRPSFRSTSTSDRWLQNFFKAAGMENVDNLQENDISELMHTLGMILRESINGLMTILRGRSELKSQLRVVMTTFKATENNPLKFSPSAETVLKTFLIDRNPGFLDAVEAIREGFEDIKNHELAVNAGVQVSLLHTLKRFDPDQFEKKLEERFVINKKARCWKEYRQAYRQLIEEALDDFFGKEFVRAYEEQMNKLRPVRKG
jgi:type VI secretion system FHA domain protein